MLTHSESATNFCAPTALSLYSTDPANVPVCTSHDKMNRTAKFVYILHTYSFLDQMNDLIAVSHKRY